MVNVLNHKGQKIYYEYDQYQDALFLTFVKNPPLSYYEEQEKGIMVRKDAETDKTIGFTVRNISVKILESYLDDSLTKNVA